MTPGLPHQVVAPSAGTLVDPVDPRVEVDVVVGEGPAEVQARSSPGAARVRIVEPVGPPAIPVMSRTRKTNKAVAKGRGPKQIRGRNLQAGHAVAAGGEVAGDSQGLNLSVR